MTSKESKNARELDQLLSNFAPFAEQSNISKWLRHLPINFLEQIYFFRISEIILPVRDTGEQDDFRYFNQRFQSVLSAVHAMGCSAATIISGSAHSVNLYLGFIPNEKAFASKMNLREIFLNLLNGLIPGTSAQYCEQKSVLQFLKGEMRHGGLVTGLPVLKQNDEHQKFNLSSIIRSMRGQDYILMFISSPILPEVLSSQMREMCDIRDRCHTLAKRTRSTNIAFSESHTSNVQEPLSGMNRLMSASLPLVGSLVGAVGGARLGMVCGPEIMIRAVSVGDQIGGRIGTAISDVAFAEPIKSHGTTSSESFSENLSFEEQNSVALELEQLAERQVERLVRGVNIGAWKTIITFVTKTPEGRQILAASFNGELAKPSRDMFPPNFVFEDVNPERPLLFPVANDKENIFSRSLISTLTNEELAHISMPPVEPFLGYSVSKAPILGLSLPKSDDDPSMSDKGAQVIGCICENGEPLNGGEFSLNSGDMAKHVFVCGITGSGKTTTVKALIETCDVPFLVVESAKREYRKIIASDRHRESLLIYTIGEDTAPLSMNPFYVMEGVSLSSHIDFLMAIFNAAFSLFDPLPYILEKCIHEAYCEANWNLRTGKFQGLPCQLGYPTILDLKQQVEIYLKKSKYTGEVKDNIHGALVARLESLCVGARGDIFNTKKKFDIESLLTRPTVLELEALSNDDDKAFFIGILLTFLSEYRQLNNNREIDQRMQWDRSLKHLLVVEEAHRLLKNTAQDGASEHRGNPRGKALEFFANVLAEMRSMGQGVIVSEQIPSKLLPDVIKNTNTKIVHRMVAADDQKLIGSSLGLSADEEKYLNTLKTGHALYFSEGMKRPTEIKVSDNTLDMRITNQRVKRQYETLLEIA
ncbi:MAG: ATP-binding protein [Aestuariivita sp.]|nr:ATP-binding protein [Aestuariivita sp.]